MPRIWVDCSKFRNRVSDYLLAVDLLVSTLRDLMPVIRQQMSKVPDKSEAMLVISQLDRLEECLVRVENKGAEKE